MFQSLVFVTSCAQLADLATAGGLTSLPSDIGMHTKWAAFNYAWAATNERMGPKGDVAQNQLAAQNHIDQMTKLSKNLLPESAITHFKWMAFNSGWATANLRNYYQMRRRKNSALKSQGDANLNNIQEHLNALLNFPELDNSLVNNMHWLCLRAGWFAANTRAGVDQDAKTDWAYFEDYAGKISSTPKLLKLDFVIDQGKMLSERPMIVSDQVLSNEGDVAESMTFSFQVTQGRTDQWSNNVGFKIGIEEDIKAGFIFGGEETKVSFEASYSHTWGGSELSSTTKTYSFPLTVPAHSVYEAKAVVHQASMEVPYAMTLLIGNTHWKIEGTWSGVAVSSATYDVQPVSHFQLALISLRSNTEGWWSYVGLAVILGVLAVVGCVKGHGVRRQRANDSEVPLLQ